MTDINKIIGWAENILAEARGTNTPAEPTYIVIHNKADLKTAILDGVTDIRLASEDWADLKFDNTRPLNQVYIAPLDTSHLFPPILVRRSDHLTFDGFSLLRPTTPIPSIRKLVEVGSDASSIELKNLRGYMSEELVEHPKAYGDWNSAGWLAYKFGGFGSGAAGTLIEGCEVFGAYMAFELTGAGSISRNNKAHGVSGDGIRLVGDNCLSENDYIEDMFQINGNHSDILQSWSIGADGKPGTGVRKGLTIRGLVARQWTLDDGGANPLRAQPQGIGFFDGMYENTLIEDCDLDVGAYHGIAVYGGINTTIRRNKVWDHFRPEATQTRPWIRINDHKKGMQSTGSVIEDNVCQKFSIDDPDAILSGNTKVNA